MKVIAHQDSKVSTKNSTAAIWQLSVEKYHEAIAKGILNDEKLELLEGLLIAKMPKNPPHRLATGLLQDLLLSFLPFDYHLNLQEPITLADSEPEPDLAIIRGRRLDYRDRHPFAADLEIVIEVSDSTLERDRTLKQRIYAKSMIPTYWILNLIEHQLEIYTQPDLIGEKYSLCQIFKEGESVSIALRDKEIGAILVKDLF
jgi:Uma2 family endonuclease